MDIQKFLRTQPLENMLNIIKDLVATVPSNDNGEKECFLDNESHCVTHGWYNSQIECPHKRAKALLIATCWFCDEEGYLDKDIGDVAVRILCDHEE